MKLVLTLLLWTMSTVCGQARLGETIKDLKRRYGQPMEVEATKESGTTRYLYAWDRYTITVLVQEGRSVSEEFTDEFGLEGDALCVCAMTPEPFEAVGRWYDDFSQTTDEEVRDLLVEGSDPGLAWTQVDGSTWHQRDRTAIWTARSLVVQEKARGR